MKRERMKKAGMKRAGMKRASMKRVGMKFLMRPLGLLLYVLPCFLPAPAYAAPIPYLPEEYVEEINEYLSVQDAPPFRFEEVFSLLREGDVAGLLETAGSRLLSAAGREIGDQLTLIRKLIMLALAAAVFSVLAGAFRGSGISESGFFAVYLCLMILLPGAFHATSEIGAGLLQMILDFLVVALPSFFVLAAVTGNSLSAPILYELIMSGIGAVQLIFLHVLIPAAEIYVSLSVLNHLSKHEYLAKASELLRTVILWSVKILTGLILGFSVVQNMILPMADSLQSTTVRKAVSAIPWLGAGADVALQTVLGAGLLIKNTAGMAIAVLVVLLCALPAVKLGLIALLYHLAAAVLQPAADARIVACLSRMASGTELLLKIVLSAAALFLIVIVIICMGTNTGYYAG